MPLVEVYIHIYTNSAVRSSLPGATTGGERQSSQKMRVPTRIFKYIRTL